MSWSGNVEVPKGTGPVEAAAMVSRMDIHGNDDCPDERARAVDAAADAAARLLQSGALGEAADYGWKVFLSGHCNPGNAPREGWSNDCVTVTISQVP